LYSSRAGGNGSLEEQKTSAYEIGVTHAFTDAINGSVALFYNDIKDLIVRGDDKNYYNTDEAEILGVECALGADITDSLWVGVNYTYLNTEDKEDGSELLERPRHRANLDTRYHFPFGLSASAQLSYTNRQTYEAEVAKKTYERLEGDDFLLLNARLEQSLPEVMGFNGKAFLEVSNLTDRDYTEGGDLMPGRNFLAGLNFTY
jgi:outer membrane receptor protein involved in Fe transport